MLSAASYALRSIKPYMPQEVMKMVYYAYFSLCYVLRNNILGESLQIALKLQYSKEGN
jgi:hypothetical protein